MVWRWRHCRRWNTSALQLLVWFALGNSPLASLRFRQSCETNSCFSYTFKRTAFVGAESLPQVFYQALKTFSQREFLRFETLEEAMDWLVGEEIA